MKKEEMKMKKYLEDICYHHKMQTTYGEVMLKIFSSRMNQDNIIIMDKESISEELGVSTSFLTLMFTKLVKNKIFKRVNRGIYKVNPNIYINETFAGNEDLSLVVNYYEDKVVLETFFGVKEVLLEEIS